MFIKKLYLRKLPIFPNVPRRITLPKMPPSLPCWQDSGWSRCDIINLKDGKRGLKPPSGGRHLSGRTRTHAVDWLSASLNWRFVCKSAVAELALGWCSPEGDNAEFCCEITAGLTSLNQQTPVTSQVSISDHPNGRNLFIMVVDKIAGLRIA